MALESMGLTYGTSVGMSILVIALTIWSLIWNGFGLWYSARNRQRIWFVAILLLNTLGILPIIYIIFFRNRKTSEVVAKARPSGKKK